MRLLAMLGMKLFVYDDAEFLLESCVEFAPDYWLARYDYINVLHKRQKFEKALEQAKILLDAYPDNHAFQLAYANENVAVGNFDTALEIYDRVIEKHPAFAQPCLSRGHALKTIGRLEDAIQSYRSAYRAKPDFGDAFWSLANLKTYRFTDGEIEPHAGPARRPGHRQCRPLSPVLRAGCRLRGPRGLREVVSLLRAGNLLKQQDYALRPGWPGGGHAPPGRVLHRRAVREQGGHGQPATTIRFLSSACRAPARPCSSRSWRRTRWSTAPWSCRTSSPWPTA